MDPKKFDLSNTHKLDAPERAVYLPPDEVVQALALARNEVVADIGAGTGYFALPIAHALADGCVYAVDAQSTMLSLLKEKLVHEPDTRIEPVQAKAEETGLPTGSCTLVFLANIWHEFDDRGLVLRETIRLLKRPGRIAILDWRPDLERKNGPPREVCISASAAEAELKAAGFQEIKHQNIGAFSWLVQGMMQPV